MKFYPRPEKLAAKHLGGWCLSVQKSDTDSDKLAVAIAAKYPDSPQLLVLGMAGGLAKCDTKEEAVDLYEFFNNAPGTRATLYHNGEIQYDD
jgi:hypothetical protein